MRISQSNLRTMIREEMTQVFVEAKLDPRYTLLDKRWQKIYMRYMDDGDEDMAQRTLDRIFKNRRTKDIVMDRVKDAWKRAHGKTPMSPSSSYPNRIFTTLKASLTKEFPDHRFTLPQLRKATSGKWGTSYDAMEYLAKLIEKDLNKPRR